jgi:hypothetical protein
MFERSSSDDSTTFKEPFKPHNFNCEKSSVAKTIEKYKEVWGQKKDKGFSRQAKTSALSFMYLIPWWGEIEHNGKSIEITNTYQIDNHIQIIYSLYLFKPDVVTFIRERYDNESKLLLSICKDLEMRIQ